MTDEAEECAVEVRENLDGVGVQEALQRLEHRPGHWKTLLFSGSVQAQVHEESGGVFEPVGYLSWLCILCVIGKLQLSNNILYTVYLNILCVLFEGAHSVLSMTSQEQPTEYFIFSCEILSDHPVDE